MSKESRHIAKLYAKLLVQPRVAFPQPRSQLEVPQQQGVYIIYKGKRIMHVGRTLRGKQGLHQRLMNHLHGQSSFTYACFKGEGYRLRKGYSYCYLVVEHARKRALLEALATGTLCPQHVGLGEQQ